MINNRDEILRSYTREESRQLIYHTPNAVKLSLWEEWLGQEPTLLDFKNKYGLFLILCEDLDYGADLIASTIASNTSWLTIKIRRNPDLANFIYNNIIDALFSYL